MNQTKLRISSYEIDDAILSSPTEEDDTTISIPCNSDRELCMQLDGWDEHTSIPALLNDKHILLYRKHYDRQKHAWVMRVV
ncbi:YebV family protein [Photorhabdus temperata]|uniref:DUF1480 domain-containing protein n=2 Tax=Photorhabdus temperata TaxID=574560 RepID=A0A081RZD1_PHOTE|nr:DUF1480 family protein [Photorhabdus temperata]EQC00618.1 hypothetical protein B738_09976 [Photorhabdus temperata subsp. temperata M1021]ERT14048.1 hypothetical protein O185_05755 [Photorhabdus temperata J3]KER04034.1 Protein of unknown function (DUF1480) [Photorhabdus temperata subsp. temperata Meg1]MCT8347674.1 YebV family protein [Photorhabdus temperata]